MRAPKPRRVLASSTPLARDWVKRAVEVVRAHAFARAGFWGDEPLPALEHEPQSLIESVFLTGLLAHARLRSLNGSTRWPVQGACAHTNALARRAATLIHERCAEPRLRATDIAEAEGISEWTLSKRLRVTGRTFPQHLHDARIEIARPMVGTPGASIAAIANVVGYTRPGEFAHHFRERTGVSPTGWRRLYGVRRCHAAVADPAR